MIKGYQSEILKIYEKIREEEEKALNERKDEIEAALPEVLEIERKIGKLCIQLSISAFKDIKNRDEYLVRLKEKITDLRIKKSELLVSRGYDMDYLNLHYRCPKCKDTGFIKTKKCSCFHKKLVNIYYQNSDLRETLMENNFKNFKLEYFSSHRDNNNPDSPRRNMEKVLTKAHNFIDKFKYSNENLLFYGNSGTGKTFLSHCIAKELLDNGLLVIYRTSEELINSLKDIRFNKDSNLQDLLFNCDLLIIDDLGTEQNNDFSRTEFFNLLNKRLIRKKKMLISTNLSLESLMKSYSERTTSRLLGNFTLCKFYGDDIRIRLNLKKLK
jgi:DNA replication protein DnaC